MHSYVYLPHSAKYNTFPAQKYLIFPDAFPYYTFPNDYTFPYLSFQSPYVTRLLRTHRYKFIH